MRESIASLSGVEVLVDIIILVSTLGLAPLLGIRDLCCPIVYNFSLRVIV